MKATIAKKRKFKIHTNVIGETDANLIDFLMVKLNIGEKVNERGAGSGLFHVAL
jgi:hypothetical protein